MKRVLLSVALLAGAFCFSFAQTKNVKDAKKLANQSNPDFGQAEQLINAAMTNGETMNDPETWDVAGFIKQRYVEEEQKKQYLKKAYDTVGVYNSIIKMCEYYNKCDELAQIPNSKGKIKNKFRKNNAKTIEMNRLELFNAGVYYFNNNQNREAYEAFSTYLESAHYPMFDGKDLVSEDQYYSTIAYYATLAGLRLEDYAAIEKVAPLAVNDTTEEAMQALEILALSYQKQDKTDEFLATLKQGVEKFPKDLYFFGNLVEHFIKSENLDGALALADEMIAKDPENSYYAFIKGFIYHHKEELDEAAKYFLKAIELDENNAEANSNYALMLTIKAQKILDAIPVELTPSDEEYQKATAEAKALYNEALPYYLKAREVSPDNKNLWANGLYLIYYKLGMDAELEEVEAYIK